MIRSFKLSEGKGKCTIEAIIVNCGNDLSVTIGGGEKYHIGAVAVSVPRHEYKDGKKRTASTSVICVQGHREDELTYKAAKMLATALDCTVTVSMGAHIDNIAQDEFHEMINNINILLDRIIENAK
ncbi:hypothetical protein HZF24_16965 [Sedimentibacter hydroxybenzoicus DSM 7310]|uniref:Prenylated flavin chaperone LpdD-like domain-containing protein n=1 Tax=Sedimentibacter hydroxybenzoicus DSM 7310 TaxID=1123245 RepID=A0A974BN63_SEDHY|nr:hypothetical protein [Sedimentibacter hydroxybenzoicus]NYB75842.1 hypothetical protein [Sedimentibacter hydroxybenzoicus DSM 7310]